MGGSLLDDMMREGLLMIFEWRAEGCEGLSPEISREDHSRPQKE